MKEYCLELERLLEEGSSKIDAAYQVIQKMIMDDQFEAGQILSERLLSSGLGISRTPVRSALNRLHYEGYVDMKGDICTIVADLSIQDILEIYEMREALECKAAELFVHRKTPEEADELTACLEEHKRAVQAGDKNLSRELDNEMHLIIARGSKNKRLLNALSTYLALSRKSIAIGSSYEYRYDRTLVQHEAIVDSIIRGDSLQAVESMREHLADVRDSFKKRFLEY